MMWRMARFCGVEILTDVVMGNHFPVLVEVPDRAQWPKRCSAGGRFFERVDFDRDPRRNQR